tara:strand:+ start:389 stop:571 length:183 start_codon:yes stop_codon:yes gene_type:complete
MKKLKIKPKEFLRDLEDVLKIVNTIDNFNSETMNSSKLKEIVKNKEKYIKNKYKDLDSKE